MRQRRARDVRQESPRCCIPATPCHTLPHLATPCHALPCPATPVNQPRTGHTCMYVVRHASL